MSIRFLVGNEPGTDREQVALLDAATGWAFGPTFGDCDTAESFIVFAHASGVRDLRAVSERKVAQLLDEWQRACR